MRIAAEAPFFYRLVQRALWALARIFTRLDVTGIELFPLTDPLVVSPNHIHALDIAVVGMIIPRQTAILTADKWRGKLGGWVMERVTCVIYVARGEADRGALNQALDVLRCGGTLAVAPEGTRSHTGGLQEGKHGAVYLASRTGAAIVPVAVWGHETALTAWRHLRRPAIHVRVGEPLHLPPDAARARTADLHAYTDDMMLALARLLPPEYRGVYAESPRNRTRMNTDEPGL